MASQIAVTLPESSPSRLRLSVQASTRQAVAHYFGSAIVEALRQQGYVCQVGRLTLHLAREFGFCYGVDDALELAYEARRQFYDRKIYLAGEIIHNPTVNKQLAAVGIHPLDGLVHLTPQDVVIIPAFGLPTPELSRLQQTAALSLTPHADRLSTCGSGWSVMPATVSPPSSTVNTTTKKQPRRAPMY